MDFFFFYFCELLAQGGGRGMDCHITWEPLKLCKLGPHGWRS